MKAVIWTIGCIGQSSSGIALLLSSGVIPVLSQVLLKSNSFYMRGTCYFALSLFAFSADGIDLLDDIGFTAFNDTIMPMKPLDVFNVLLPTNIDCRISSPLILQISIC